MRLGAPAAVTVTPVPVVTVKPTDQRCLVPASVGVRPGRSALLARVVIAATHQEYCSTRVWPVLFWKSLVEVPTA